MFVLLSAGSGGVDQALINATGAALLFASLLVTLGWLAWLIRE